MELFSNALLCELEEFENAGMDESSGTTMQFLCYSCPQKEPSFNFSGVVRNPHFALKNIQNIHTCTLPRVRVYPKLSLNLQLAFGMWVK